MEQDISELEEGKHRKCRLPKLLYLLGKALDYGCRLANDEVIWEADRHVRISFQVTDKEVLVSASRTMPKGNIASQVGTISDEKLEKALLKWCRNNPERGGTLVKRLNSIEELSLSPRSPRHLLLKVVENRELCPEHYLITLQTPKGQNPEPRPGQFFHVICDPDGEKTLTDNEEKRGYALTLRRPFSAHRISYADFDRRFLATPIAIPYEMKDVIKRPVSQIDILYRVVGKGTRDLSRVVSGRYLDVIGPIGNGFNTDRTDAAAIVAGGIGIAPLVALAERLRYLGSRVFLYFGAAKGELLRPVLSRADSVVGRGSDDCTLLDLINNEFEEIGAEPVRISTDDGSLGEKCLVTDMLEREIREGRLPVRNTTIYACGPSAMMQAVSILARRYGMACQVLLEERMACGIGACFSCTCDVRSKEGRPEKKRVCVDGPVFDSEGIIWSG